MDLSIFMEGKYKNFKCMKEALKMGEEKEKAFDMCPEPTKKVSLTRAS